MLCCILVWCRLGDDLVRYVEEELPAFVKLVRTPQRMGLIRARLFGAEKANGNGDCSCWLRSKLTLLLYHTNAGPAIVFLDSHIEATDGWLPPLIDPIRIDRSNVVTPIIDNIDKSSMQYHAHMGMM
jgi:polypeptide N-acetylgalactosaminyltransferase